MRPGLGQNFPHKLHQIAWLNFSWLDLILTTAVNRRLIFTSGHCTVARTIDKRGASADLIHLPRQWNCRVSMKPASTLITEDVVTCNLLQTNPQLLQSIFFFELPKCSVLFAIFVILWRRLSLLWSPWLCLSLHLLGHNVSIMRGVSSLANEKLTSLFVKVTTAMHVDCKHKRWLGSQPDETNCFVHVRALR